MRHPFAVILVAAAILGTLLYPVGHMKVGIPEATVLPQEYESRAGDDILKENFEYAALNPMEIVATLGEDPLSASGLSDTKELGESISGADGVSRVESVYTIAEAAARGLRRSRRRPPGSRRKRRPQERWTGWCSGRSKSRRRARRTEP